MASSGGVVAWGPHKGRWDGCEWNPDADRGSQVGDRHFAKVAAEFEVGAASSGSICYRLCASYAALSLFAGRARRAIARQESDACR